MPVTSVLRRPLVRGLLRGLLLVQLLVLVAQPATLSACAASGPAMCSLASKGEQEGMKHAPCCCAGLAGAKARDAAPGAACAKRPQRPQQERDDRGGLQNHLDWRGILQARWSISPPVPNANRAVEREPASFAPVLDIPTPPPRFVSSV